MRLSGRKKKTILSCFGSRLVTKLNNPAHHAQIDKTKDKQKIEGSSYGSNKLIHIKIPINVRLKKKR